MEEDDASKKWMSLVEVEDGQLLFSPLSKAVKTKYTCIAASSTHVVVGANTGSLYCFTVKSFKYVRLLANMEGAVSLARFSPDEKTLAVVVGSHTVGFWEINLDQDKAESKRFHVSTILKGGTVTDVVWDSNTRLFYGDNQGRVAIAFIPKMSRKFGSSAIFKRVDEIIHNEKSLIVQLDIHKDILLVSSLQRSCFLRLTSEMVIANVIKVGTKPRDGPYGALFHPRVPGRPPVVYSARPGGRLWEADVAGRVVSTVKQKDSVTMPPSHILSLSSPSLPPPLPFHSVSSLNFPRLLLMSNTYLVAWQKDNLFLFHPASYSLLWWTNTLEDIVQVECVKEKLYILHNGCQKITCASFINMFDTLRALSVADNPPLACEFLTAHSNSLKSQVLSSEGGTQLVSTIIRDITSSGGEVPPSLVDLVPPPVQDTPAPDEEVGGAVELMVNTTANETIKNDLSIEQTAMNDNSNNQISPAKDIDETPPTVDDEGSMFLMEDGHAPNRERSDPIVSDYPSLSHSLPSVTSHSLTTPSVMATSPQLINVISLPNSLEANDGSVKISSNPSLTPPTGLYYPVDQPPLSVRMAGKLDNDDDDDEVSVVGVVRTKKKKKIVKKKKKSKSRSQSQQELEDIFETTSTSVSPSISRMSSTNPSDDNSRASSPQAKDSPMIVELDRKLSMPLVVPGSSPVDNCVPPQRSQSLDPAVVDLSSMRRQSVDLETTDLTSRLGIQKPSVILSKVKSIASTQQEKTGRKVKELFSSLSPTPTAIGTPPTVYPTSLGSAVSPSTSEISFGVGSPEMGVLPANEGMEEIDGGHLVVSQSPLESSSPVPNMESERFVAFTNEAMSALNDPVTLSYPEKFQETLTQWRKELSTYHTHLSICVAGDTNNRGCVFLVPPYSKLDTSLRHSVSELATTTLQNSLEPDDVPEYIGTYKILLDIKQTREFVGTLSYGHMKKCWDTMVCSDDIVTPNGAATHNDGVDTIKKFISNVPLMGPALLQSVYQNDVSKFLRLYSVLPDLMLWEVAMVTCYDSDHEELQPFAKYLCTLLSSNERKMSIYLQSHEELFLLSMRACLATPPHDHQLFDDQNNPMPYSDLVAWPCETGLTCLSHSLFQMSTDTQAKVVTMYEEKGYWKGLINYLEHNQRLEQLFILISKLKDHQLLKRIVTDSPSLVSTDQWKMFLENAVVHNVPMTTANTQDLSIENIIKNMVGVVGVQEACHILGGVDSLKGCDFPSSLHQFLTDATALHKEQRTVAHLLLERLDKHLWAARPASLGPHLLAVYRSKGPTITDTHDSMLPSLVSNVPSLCVNIEDSVSYWGVRTEIERCGVCGYTVSTRLTDRAGTTCWAFSCGHFYHKECLPEQACIRCFTEKYSAFMENRT